MVFIDLYTLALAEWSFITKFMKIQTAGTTTKLSVNIEKWTLKTLKEGTSRFANAKEVTDGQIGRRLKRIAVVSLKNLLA